MQNSFPDDMKTNRLRAAFQRIMRLLRKGPKKEPEAPQDPYAYVTAPLRPRRPNRGAAAVAEWPEE
jgi:hypothetical protein